MRLDAKASPELLAAIYAIRSLDKTIAKMIRQQTKRVAAPETTKAMAERADTRLEHRVMVNTAVVSVSNQNVRIQSARKGRPLKGGLDPKTDWYAVEFGGKAHQLKPRNKRGYVFYPAAREMIPRLARLWIETTVRTIATAFEGKQE
ncbi:hypothetical protein [Microbacterium sp. RG1]|uniref:hypothetical protein n=1 Tax=Microbacterium sp. RG1 TaxID=2489212 RepID=UPI0010CA4281|nr:hypothetical protein [Microbacterium sp. RG1]QCQ16987.1 hypothetical protein EHF32_09795 [Microbacterium sp. RG1]